MAKVLPEPCPFHPHEVAVQEAFDVVNEACYLGQRMILDRIADNVSTFVAQQSFLFISFVDVDADPCLAWASVIYGPVGFVTIENEGRILRIHGGRTSHAMNDPLREMVRRRQKIPMGVMAIDFAMRRRYRINGHAEFTPVDGGEHDALRFSLTVREAFVNCPKYIQARTFKATTNNVQQASKVDDSGDSLISTASRSASFSKEEEDVIRNCDTFFLATYFDTRSQNPLPVHSAGKSSSRKTTVDDLALSFNADVSHRGGAPGFIRILDHRTICWPEYAGNNMYMTLGNLHSNEMGGLLLIDFAHARCLQLSGRASLVIPSANSFSDNPHLRQILQSGMDGAEKFVVFTLLAPPSLSAVNSLPFHFTLVDTSPYNPRLSGVKSAAIPAHAPPNQQHNAPPTDPNTLNTIGMHTLESSSSNALSEGTAITGQRETKEFAMEVVPAEEMFVGDMRLDSVRPWTSAVATFIFRCRIHEEQLRNYIPGQYAVIELQLPNSDEALIRSWTITSLDLLDTKSPKAKNSNDKDQACVDVLLTLTIKRAGESSTWLHDSFNHLAQHSPDATIDIHSLWRDSHTQWTIRAITGDFSPLVRPSSQFLHWHRDVLTARRLLFVGAGIGVTPFVSSLRHLLLHHEDARDGEKEEGDEEEIAVLFAASFRSWQEASVLDWMISPLLSSTLSPSTEDNAAPAGVSGAKKRKQLRIKRLHLHIFFTSSGSDHPKEGETSDRAAAHRWQRQLQQELIRHLPTVSASSTAETAKVSLHWGSRITYHHLCQMMQEDDDEDAEDRRVMNPREDNGDVAVHQVTKKQRLMACSSRPVYVCGPSLFTQTLQYAPTTETETETDTVVVAEGATDKEEEVTCMPAWWTERVLTEDFYF